MDRGVTYIVTGCTGYVGNVLTKKLLAENCRVIGFARSHQKAEQVFKEQKPAFVFGDIANRADGNACSKEKVPLSSFIRWRKSRSAKALKRNCTT